MKTFVKKYPAVSAGELERLHRVMRHVAQLTFDIDARKQLTADLDVSLKVLSEK